MCIVQPKEVRLRRIQHLAHEVMDKVNLSEDQLKSEEFKDVIDNLSRAIGELADPYGYYSLDYIEEKVENAYNLLIKNPKKIKFHI
ncbi:MAG TPA: hypothetical protein VNS08_16775 [Ureibacillus sp.]|nr:hypothetical protein [Ureibacillus sp.]